MQLNGLNKIIDDFKETAPMPLLLVGHGSPMNALEENQFVRGWRNAALAIPALQAILCISAHWETDGTLVTAMKIPRTIHNLRKIDWQNPGGGFDWAEEANTGFKKMILGGDYDKLTSIPEMSSAYKLSVPTPEHYNPLLYVLGLKEKNEECAFFNDEIVMGSISMTSLFIFDQPFHPQLP